MSTVSAAPARSRLVLIVLLVLLALSLVLASVMMGWISYEYVTREELRNPVEETSSGGGGH